MRPSSGSRRRTCTRCRTTACWKRRSCPRSTSITKRCGTWPASRLRGEEGRHVTQDDYHAPAGGERRSEEHTSELQSRGHLVCRLLLEKKKKNTKEAAAE